MVPVADLRATVEEAERAWSDGDWLGAFQRFQKLSLALAADRDEAGAFDPNGSIVVHRYADIAAQTGRIRIALDAYGMLQQHGGDAATRALAAFKRLDLATSSLGSMTWCGASRRLPPGTRRVCAVGNRRCLGRLTSVQPSSPTCISRWDASTIRFGSWTRPRDGFTAVFITPHRAAARSAA
jgi:hypothetical protein